MATKLWQKNYTLDTMMESFTVRKDYILDVLHCIWFWNLPAITKEKLPKPT